MLATIKSERKSVKKKKKSNRRSWHEARRELEFGLHTEFVLRGREYTLNNFFDIRWNQVGRDSIKIRLLTPSLHRRLPKTESMLNSVAVIYIHVICQLSSTFAK